jgi:hypothetical protein
MSKIWDSLTAVERRTTDSLTSRSRSVAERRCGPRLWVHAPLLVYGRTTDDKPFHEPTEALRVNASGGLITLKTVVSPGHSFLLINKVNHKEQKCNVVGYRGSYLNRSAVGFEFSEPVADFWDAKQ